MDLLAKIEWLKKEIESANAVTSEIDKGLRAEDKAADRVEA